MIIHTSLIGRFGNQCLQYLAARGKAEREGHTLSTPPWIGEKIFEIPEASRSKDFVHAGIQYGQSQSELHYSRRDALNWLRLKPEIKAKLDSFVPSGEILAHRRVGDFPGYGYVVVSERSYFQAAEKFGYSPSDLQFVSEENPLTHPDFTGELAFLPDFYRLMRAKVLFRANSTFSWCASTLGEALTFSPVVADKPGGIESDCEFVWGNAQRLANLEFTTDMHLFREEERYLYDLTPDSTVIDIGGYDGDFAAEIHKRYGCYVHIYEPCIEFYDRIKARFKDNPKIAFFYSAVSNEFGGVTIRVKGSMTGEWADGPAQTAPSIDACMLEDSDLLKINCEGGEFAILESLIECDGVKKHRNIQVQVHSVVPDCVRRYKAIREGLMKTHRPTFEENWCWENWEKR